MARLFISYARGDAADLADRLRSTLAADHEVWLDRERIDGGDHWSREIEDEIDGCDVLVALLSPRAFDSPICRGEQLRALRNKKRVIPVLATPTADRPVYLEAANYRDLSTERTFEAQLIALRNDLSHWQMLPASTAPQQRFEVTPLPTVTHAIERREITESARGLLLQEVSGRAMVATVMHGFPGTGKTALAAQLCNDQRVRDAFPDGVVWVTVRRETADPFAPVLAVHRAFNEVSARIDTKERAREVLTALLSNRSVLVVLDDVWRYDQVEAFVVDAPRSRLLLTSRMRSIGPELGAQLIEVPPMSGAEASDLLAGWAGRADPAFPAIAERLGRLPLALRIAGALLARKADSMAWLESLDHVSHLAASTQAAGDRYRDLSACLALSVEELAHDQTQPPRADDRPLFEALGVFQEDVAVPLAAVKRLWSAMEPGRPTNDWTRLVEELDELGLVDLTGDALGLHDLLMDYCRFRLDPKVASVHEALLCSYKPDAAAPWSSVPDDGYLYDHLAHHLATARGSNALANLLREEDPARRGQNAWYQARAGRKQIPGFAADVAAARRHSGTLASDVRFGLMLSSLRSLGGSASPTLILAMARQGAWPIARAADHARGLTDPSDRVDALVLLGTLGPRELLREAGEMLAAVPIENRDSLAQRVASAHAVAGDPAAGLRITTRIVSLHWLCDALAEVLPALGELALGPDAEIALSRLDTPGRLKVLCAILRRSTGDCSAGVDRALQEMRAMEGQTRADLYARVESGAPLIAFLPDDERVAFLEQAFGLLSSEVADGCFPSALLEMLAPVLDGHWAQRAFAIVRDIGMEVNERLRGAKEVARCLLLLRESLDAEQRIAAANHLLSEPIQPHEIGEVIAAAGELHPGRRDERVAWALAVLQEDGVEPHEAAHALYELREHIADSQLDEALRVAGAIEDDKYRWESLLTLADRCERQQALNAMLKAVRQMSAGKGILSHELEHRCQITARLMRHLTAEQRRSELAEMLGLLDGEDASFVSLSWRSRMVLLPFFEDAEAASDRIETMADHLLESAREPGEYLWFAENLPPRFLDLVINRALAYGEVGPRRQLLSALAPRLSVATAAGIADRLDVIADSLVQAQTAASLHAAEKISTNVSGAQLELLILEELSKELGPQIGDAAEWVHRLAATRCAQCGDSDLALGMLRRLPCHLDLYRLASADVAIHLPAALIESEVNRRLKSGRPSDTTPDDADARVAAWPENIAPLLHGATADFRMTIRERTRKPGGTEYARTRHDALFASVVNDDRNEVIGRYFALLDKDTAAQKDTRFVEALAPYVDSRDLDRLAAVVDHGESSEARTTIAAFAVAARDPSRLGWALRKLAYLDKPYRAPSVAIAAAAFPDRLRTVLAAESLPYAQAWSAQCSSVGALCLTAMVDPDKESREKILLEALSMVIRFPRPSDMTSEFSVVAAYIMLLLDKHRLQVLRTALDLASGKFRECFLRTLEGLRFPIRSLADTGELTEMGRAIDDSGRWWP